MVHSLCCLHAALGGTAHNSPRRQRHDDEAQDHDDQVRKPGEVAVEDTKLFLEKTKGREEQHRETETNKDAPEGSPEYETPQIFQGLDRLFFDVLDEQDTDFFKVPLNACPTKEPSPRRIPHDSSLLSPLPDEVGRTGGGDKFVALVDNACFEK